MDLALKPTSEAGQEDHAVRMSMQDKETSDPIIHALVGQTIYVEHTLE